MDSSVSGKDEIWFLRVCHHVPHELYNKTNKRRATKSAYVDVGILSVSSRSARTEMKIFKVINSIDFLIKT